MERLNGATVALVALYSVFVLLGVAGNLLVAATTVFKKWVDSLPQLAEFAAFFHYTNTVRCSV